MYFPKFWVSKFEVKIIAPPVPVIKSPKTILSPGESIVLNPADMSGSLRYQWFVNNEYRGSEPSLNFSSLVPGRYLIKLIADNGSSDSRCSEASATKMIRVNSQPYVEISSPKVIGRVLTATISASNATDNDGDKLTYAWSGAGIVGSKNQSTVTVKHDEAGTYRIQLTVSDQTGTTNSEYTASFAYRVDADPIPVFAIPAQAAPGDRIVLSGSGTKDQDDSSLIYTWTISDGKEFSGPERTFSFDKPGDYIVKLTVDDGEGVSNSIQSVEHKIHIDAPPVPLITAADHSNMSRQSFSASKSSDADPTKLTYSWDFGDGSGGTGETVTHVFEASGKYTITLTADDGQGQSNSVQKATHVLVINRNPVAEFSIPSTWEPLKPLHVNGAKSYDPDGIVTEYTWLLNGQVVANDSATDLIFPEPGDYAVGLKVKDNSGFDDAIGLKTARIHINYPPVIKWETDPKVAEPGESVTFDSKGSYDPDGNIKTVTWNFSDGTSMTGPVVIKSFKNAGVVKIKITSDDGEGFNNSVQTKEFSLLVNNPPIIVTKDFIRTNSRVVSLDASQSYDIDGQALKFDWLLLRVQL